MARRERPSQKSNPTATPDTQRDAVLTAEGFRELTDEEQAALDAHQAEQDARDAARRPRPETAGARLSRLFRETPEMKELQKLTDAVHDHLNRKGNRKIEVSVPIAFIEMLKFIEKNDAKMEGRKPRTVSQVLTKQLHFSLHDRLHFLCVDPFVYEYYRAVWDRLAVAEGHHDKQFPLKWPESDHHRDKLLQQVRKTFGDTGQVIEFHNARQTAKEAAERGDVAVSLPAALSARVFAHVQPQDVPYLREVFNQLCNEFSIPGAKLPINEPGEKDGEEGPF